MCDWRAEMGEEASIGIFRFMSEIDHFRRFVLGDDWNVAEEGIMGALEILR